MKLMKLYYLILQEIENLPDVYSYKFLSREMTKFRMKVVDDNKSVRDIENKISAGLIEELIFAAHNEIKLLRLVGKWKPWEAWNDTETDKEALMMMGAWRDN